jgi:hypothetical protein
MKPIRHVIWEIVLILASVLIFRSLWLLMDSVIDFNSTEFLIVSFIIGVSFSALAFRRLVHAD